MSNCSPFISRILVPSSIFQFTSNSIICVSSKFDQLKYHVTRLPSDFIGFAIKHFYFWPMSKLISLDIFKNAFNNPTCVLLGRKFTRNTSFCTSRKSIFKMLPIPIHNTLCQRVENMNRNINFCSNFTAIKLIRHTL